MKYIYSLVFLLISLSSIEAQIHIDLASMIDKDQAILFSFRPTQLNKKIPYSQIQAYPFVEDFTHKTAEFLMPKNQGALKDILMHPIKYGVSDTMMVHLGLSSFEGNSFTQLYFQNNNATLLYRMVAKALEQTGIITMGIWSGISQVNSSILWNKGASILTTVGGMKQKYNENDLDFNERCKDKLRPFVGQQSKMKEEETLANIEAFNTYQKSDADFSIWINCKTFLEQYGNNTLAANSWLHNIAQRLDYIYNGHYLAVHFYLEKGAIRIQTQLHLNEFGQEVAQAAQKQRWNKNMFKYANATEPLEYTSLKLDFKAWANQWYKSSNQLFNQDSKDKKFSQLLSVLSVFLDEKALENTFKGDALFLTSQIQEKEQLDTVYTEDDDEAYYEVIKSKKLLPTFTWLLSYYKADKLTPFLEMGQSLGFLAKTNDTHYEVKTALFNFPIGTHFYLNKGILLITNDEKVAQNPSKGIDKQLWMSKTQQKKVSQSALSSYYNIAKMAEHAAKITAPKTQAFWNTVKLYFKDFSLYTLAPKEGILPQEGSIELQSSEAPAGNLILEALQSWYDTTKE